jgi:hypothetical protein
MTSRGDIALIFFAFFTRSCLPKRRSGEESESESESE